MQKSPVLDYVMLSTSSTWLGLMLYEKHFELVLFPDKKHNLLVLRRGPSHIENIPVIVLHCQYLVVKIKKFIYIL